MSSVEELFSEPSATQKARDEVGEEEALSVQKSRLVKRIFDERIFPLWEELVTKRAKEDVEEEKKHVLVKLEDGTQAPPAIRRTGLQRFEPGAHFVIFCPKMLKCILCRLCVYTSDIKGGVRSRNAQRVRAGRTGVERSACSAILAKRQTWRLV